MMTTMTITFNSNSDLKKFTADLKRTIKGAWAIAKDNKKATNNSFLRHERLVLSLIFSDKNNQTIRIGYLILGIFNSYVKIIDVIVRKKGAYLINKDFETEIAIEDDYYPYLIEEFISMISNLQTFELIKNKDLFIKPDLNQFVNDIRMIRPRAVKDKKTDKMSIVSRMEMYNINGNKIAFIPPNNVALLLNIAKKESEIAKDIFSSTLKDTISKKSKIQNELLSELYDYFEHIQISIISSYTAVEAFCNIAIPVGYRFERSKKKGITEILDKSVIERNLTTSEKLKDCLPKILIIATPANEKFWSKFVLLESFRNNIIHQKTATEDLSKSAFQVEFLKESIFDIIYSAFEVVEYFCNTNTKHSFFPLGISDSEIELIEVGDFQERFTKFNDKEV